MAVLVLVTITHSIYRLNSIEGETGFDYAETPTRIGRPITQMVKNLGTDRAKNLADVQKGFCRYIIVASGLCSFCKEQAVKWTVAASLEPEGLLVPDEWRTFWVFVEPGELASEFKDSRFPAPRYRASNNARFMKEAGVTSFPYHLVLDPQGRVTAAGTGGWLHERESFQSDCTLKVGGE